MIFLGRCALIFLLGMIALACGGGGSSSTTGDTTSSAFSIELVHDTSARSKLAVLPEGTPLIIGSDLSDREDPLEATAVKVSIENLEGKVFGSVTKDVVRLNESPFNVDTSFRTITLQQLQFGDELEIKVKMGRDIDVETLNRSEIIIYSGRLNGITVKPGGVFLNGEPISSIKVPVKINVDPNAKTISVQGYIDFSSVPDIPLKEQEFETITEPTTTLLSIGSTDNYQTVNRELAERTQPNAQFFEVPTVKTNTNGLLTVVRSGGVRELVMTGYATKDEIFQGRPFLFDWETTVTTTFALWILGTVDIPHQQLETTLVKSIAFYQAIIDKLNQVGEDGFIDMNIAEFTYFKFLYEVANTSRISDPLGTLISPLLIETKLVARFPLEVEKMINFFFIDQNKQVRVTGSTNTYKFSSSISRGDDTLSDLLLDDFTGINLKSFYDAFKAN